MPRKERTEAGFGCQTSTKESGTGEIYAVLADRVSLCGPFSYSSYAVSRHLFVVSCHVRGQCRAKQCKGCNLTCQCIYDGRVVDHQEMRGGWQG